MRREIAYNDLVRGAEVSAQESLLVLRLKANDDAAYDELVRTYNQTIFHVAFRMLGDTAEASDAVQEVFIKIFRNIGGFKGEAALKTWIFKIAFSEILNRLRWWKRRHRSSTVSLDDQSGGDGYCVPDLGPSPDKALEYRERDIAIQQALGRLSRDHRSIVVLR